MTNLQKVDDAVPVAGPRGPKAGGGGEQAMGRSWAGHGQTPVPARAFLQTWFAEYEPSRPEAVQSRAVKSDELRISSRRETARAASKRTRI